MIRFSCEKNDAECIHAMAKLYYCAVWDAAVVLVVLCTLLMLLLRFTAGLLLGFRSI